MLGHRAISEAPLSARPLGRQSPGGIWRRGRGFWSRVFERVSELSWSRVWRAPAVRGRVWRYQTVSTPVQTLTKTVSDDRDFGFDLTAVPEIVLGATIASAEITGGSGLTIGAAAANVAAFDGIAAGKAVVARISGGTAGSTYHLAAKATLSTGRLVTIPAKLVVTADYNS